MSALTFSAMALDSADGSSKPSWARSLSRSTSANCAARGARRLGLTRAMTSSSAARRSSGSAETARISAARLGDAAASVSTRRSMSAARMKASPYVRMSAGLISAAALRARRTNPRLYHACGPKVICPRRLGRDTVTSATSMGFASRGRSSAALKVSENASGE